MSFADVPSDDVLEQDCSRAAGLATTGFAMKLASPALMHTLKGHLHNLRLLSELLLKEATTTRDPDAARASTAKRARTIRSEVEAIHRHLILMERLAGRDDGPREGFCDVHSGLAEVLQAVRVEAVRRSVDVRLDVMPEPMLIVCPPSAFQQLILTCTIHTIQRSRDGESIVIGAHESNGVTRFDFLCGELDETTSEIDHALDLDLLATLAGMAGAHFVAQPTMRVAFRTASH